LKPPLQVISNLHSNLIIRAARTDRNRARKACAARARSASFAPTAYGREGGVLS
jgi:hypothetical protein